MSCFFTTKVLADAGGPFYDAKQPNVSIDESNRKIKISGTGFDENTRVSIAFDGANRRLIKSTLKCSDYFLPYDIEVSDNKAFIANHNNGLAIIDITDTTAPATIHDPTSSSNRLVDYPRTLAVDQNHLYTSDGSYSQNQFKVIDISNCSAPNLVGAVNIDGYLKAISVSENTVFAVGGGAKLLAFDVSTPSNPQKLGELALTSPEDLAIHGHYALIANSGDGIAVVDISTPPIFHFSLNLIR